MEKPKILTSSTKIRFQDCDPFNHLNNGRYIDYFINQREDQVLNAYGIDIFKMIREDKKGWVVSSTQLAYIIPVFTMEKEGLFEKLFDRVMALTGYKDIDFEMYPNFSNKFLITGKNETEIRAFFTDELIRFFESRQIYHIESNGEALILFDKIKLARTDETMSILAFTEALANLLK